MTTSSTVAGLAVAAALAFTPLPSIAHGTMEVPVSRIYTCYQEGPEAPKTAACKAVVAAGGTQPLYDWNEVSQAAANGDHKAVVPDGKLCAGGRDKYVGLDLARSDWTTTSIVPDADGTFTFVYLATAVHATKAFDFYITKDGWKPTETLDWSDLKKFASVAAPTAVDKRYTMTVAMPSGMTGRRVIYVTWQRSDSQEAFYSCSDVEVAASGSGGGSDPTWSDAGQLIATSDLAIGSVVTFRIFDADGSDAGSYRLKATSANAAADQWPFRLAKKLNAADDAFMIGIPRVRTTGTVILPMPSATRNHVYLSSAYPGYSYEIDIDTPAGTPSATAWKEGATYAVGDRVTYLGKTYICLQAHTAWAGAGWTPSTTETLWQVAG